MLLKTVLSKVLFVFLVFMLALSLKRCFVEESRELLLEKEGCFVSPGKREHTRVSKELNEKIPYKIQRAEYKIMSLHGPRRKTGLRIHLLIGH